MDQNLATPNRQGPSPAETDAVAWAAIGEASQRKFCAGARGLSNFVHNTAHAHLTGKNDERTNIIDQESRTTYALGPELVHQLFGFLEACRLEGSTSHFSERQGTPAAPYSGLMLDYDIITTQRRPVLTDRHYYRIAGSLAAALQRDLNLAGPSNAVECRFHIFFIIRVETTAIASDMAAVGPGMAGGVGPGAPNVPGAATYKYGIHILVPGLQLSRAYKKLLVRNFRSDPAVGATLTELGAVGDPANCLDQNSASVPVLFFGSCKRGGTPYILGSALEVTLDLGGCADGTAATWTSPPVVKRLPATELTKYNLVAELSLVVEAEYSGCAGASTPLVQKRTYECRPDVAAAANDWAARSGAAATSEADLVLAEHTLSTLTLHNAEARHLHALLDLLQDYASDRNRWRDVVFALANTNDQYKPLAIWFSQKCPEKWADGGEAALDALWEEAIARTAAAPGAGGAGRLTIRSLAFWARTADPVRYAEVMERSYFTMLTSYVYEHGGRLQHYMVAKVLHAMLGAKFCVDIDAGPRGAQSYCWFEFVVPGQQMRPGEVWKWRREIEPDDVHIYMSEKLTRVLDQISEHIDEKAGAAGEEQQAKYYKNLGKTFAMSKVNLYNDTFKNGVIRQANYLFRRRGFAEQLDTVPSLFGTSNGVLQLGPRCTLIDYFHEHPVSRFSPVAWRPFDPDEPWTRIALDAIAAIIYEPDARDWILFHACQGLSGEPKEGLLLFWNGGGQNGKTSYLRWIAKALGPCGDKFNIQLMCCEREEADRPNSAMMKFKNLNYAYSEESNKSQTLNVARMKEMVNAGEVSGRELNSRQETFTMRANLVAASQYDFNVDTTDHGTWRRIRHYTSKTKFRKVPDPKNPFERAEDQRFVRQYPTDPLFQAAILSILSHYYERLQNEYGGELKNVRSPTIEAETEAFRVSQDSLHRWICESVVVSPDHETEYTLAVLAGIYIEWYGAHIDKKRHHVPGEIIKEIENSALGKYLKLASNRVLVVRGCRVLTKDDHALRPGEDLVSNVENGRTGPATPTATAGEANWWAARSPPAPARTAANMSPADAELARELARDDQALFAATRAATRPDTGADTSAITDGDFENIYIETAATIDDLYD